MKTREDFKRFLLNEIRAESLDGDAWGTCMGWLFAIAGHLHELGGFNDPPASWQYRCGVGGGIELECYEAQALACLREGIEWNEKDRCWEDCDFHLAAQGLDFDADFWDEKLGPFKTGALDAVREVGEILHRYSGQLRAAGKSY